MLHPDDLALSGPARFGREANPIADCEYRIRRADTGEERWIARRGEVVLNASGERLYLGIAFDITRQKRDQALLQAANATLERTVDTRTRERDRMWQVSQDAFVVFDLDGRHLSVSPAFTRLLGWSEAEVVGQLARPLIHPDDWDRALAARARLMAGETTWRFENRVLHKRGGWRWLSWTAVLDDGRIYSVARDVTAEKGRTDELAVANAALRAEIIERERVEATLRQMQRLEAVGQLTAGVAHDFNNLLTVVIGNLEFLQRTMTDTKDLRRVAIMQQAATRGAKLTAQLLAFSRSQRLVATAVDLNETVTSMQDLLDSSTGAGMELRTELAAGLWPALVDATQIELAILNLAINARDAMEGGGGVITIRTANETLRAEDAAGLDNGAGEYVLVSVGDTGTGMSAEVAAKAFEPFFTTKEVGRGSGLGLAQVYGFVRQSGGTVRLNTAPGAGTVVTVLLPRATAPGAEGTEDGSPTAMQPRCVLVVDDDAAVREVAAMMLAGMGHRVIEAGSGKDALALLERSDCTVDVALLDLSMPGMDGTATAAAVRALRPGLPLVFVTGYADVAAWPDVADVPVVRKPFRQHDLETALLHVLAMQNPPTAACLPSR